jgi:hypothetical protein
MPFPHINSRNEAKELLAHPVAVRGDHLSEDAMLKAGLRPLLNLKTARPSSRSFSARRVEGRHPPRLPVGASLLATERIRSLE